MGIDWLTVGAQALNFLVLVWLLQHFLYDPVINAMDRRERRIANRLEEAQKRETEAEEEAEKHRKHQQALEEERQQRIEEAEAEAKERRQELLEEAREEVRRTREQWERDLVREQEELKRSLRRSAAQAVERISRRVLADLAGTDLEARMAERFLRQLEEAEGGIRTGLAEAETLTVRTAFVPSEELQERLREGLREELGRKVEPEFRQAGDLLCGIEVTGGGRKVAWSVDHYLSEVEDALERTLGRRAGAPAPAGA